MVCRTLWSAREALATERWFDYHCRYTTIATLNGTTRSGHVRRLPGCYIITAKKSVGGNTEIVTATRLSATRSSRVRRTFVVLRHTARLYVNHLIEEDDTYDDGYGDEGHCHIMTRCYAVNVTRAHHLKYAVGGWRACLMPLLKGELFVA